jgi:hypothetical protein
MSSLNVNTIAEYTSGNGVTIDGVLIKDGYVGNTVEADQYLLPSDLSSDTDPITTFQRPTGTLQTYAGTGMTYTSGVFSFPKTGIWKVSIMGRIKAVSTGHSAYLYLHTTNNDGTSYDIVLALRNEDEASRRTTVFGTTILDITDISNDKVKISFDEVTDAALEGGSAEMVSGVVFERLGDT